MIGYIGQEVTVTIHRPLGSRHPEQDLYYPVNYGYVEASQAGVEAKIDAYILGVYTPLESYTGIVIGLIKRHNDAEDQLVVAKTLNQFDRNQIQALTAFQERFYQVEILTFDYLRQSIRNTVRAVIRRGDRVLMLEESHDGEMYYYLPGGGIEFLESTREALIREIKEELNAVVIGYNPLDTVSNIFELKGIKAHEIAQIYSVVLEDMTSLTSGTKVEGDLLPSTLRWIEISELKKGDMTVYPKALVNMLY